MEWCGESGVPFSIIFTKTDKLKPNAILKNVEIYKQKLLESWEELPEIFATSAEKKEGCDEVLSTITQTNLYLRENKVDFSKN